MEYSRRIFLTGRRSEGKVAFRPPWAPEENKFLESCTRCGDCVTACETGLLNVGGGGFPEAGFKAGQAGYCSFCGACAAACQPGVLQPEAGRAPWSQVISIASNCLTQSGVVCRTCFERCEEGAIRFPLRLGGVAAPVLEASRCTGCGTCLADCPTRAISMLPRGTGAEPGTLPSPQPLSIQVPHENC